MFSEIDLNVIGVCLCFSHILMQSLLFCNRAVIFPKKQQNGEEVGKEQTPTTGVIPSTSNDIPKAAPRIQAPEEITQDNQLSDSDSLASSSSVPEIGKQENISPTVQEKQVSPVLQPPVAAPQAVIRREKSQTGDENASEVCERLN